jgi:hypothetical protein
MITAYQMELAAKMDRVVASEIRASLIIFMIYLCDLD